MINSFFSIFFFFNIFRELNITLRVLSCVPSNLKHKSTYIEARVTTKKLTKED